MKRFFFTALFAYAFVILSAAFIQSRYMSATGIKIFPDYDEIMPHQVEEFRHWYKNRNTPPVQIEKKKYFHTGENHSSLAKFFTQLSALEQKGISRVRILH